MLLNLHVRGKFLYQLSILSVYTKAWFPYDRNDRNDRCRNDRNDRCDLRSYGNHSYDRCDHMETTLAIVATTIVAIVAIIWKPGFRSIHLCYIRMFNTFSSLACTPTWASCNVVLSRDAKSAQSTV